jgi:hypothetical protein
LSNLKISQSTEENMNPNVFSNPKMLQHSAATEYQGKLKEYKCEIKKLLVERKKARLTSSKINNYGDYSLVSN